MGVDAESDRGVGVTEAGRDDVDRDTGQEQRRGVDVAEIVQTGVG